MIITQVEKLTTPIDQRCVDSTISMSPTVSSQDCGYRSLVTLLYLEKYTWGIVQYVQTLSVWLKGAKTVTMEKDINKKLLQDHQEAQALERRRAMHHRDKSMNKPKQYMCLMIDGMDQKKTCLPHLRRLPKDFDDECLV